MKNRLRYNRKRALKRYIHIFCHHPGSQKDIWYIRFMVSRHETSAPNFGKLDDEICNPLISKKYQNKSLFVFLPIYRTAKPISTTQPPDVLCFTNLQIYRQFVEFTCIILSIFLAGRTVPACDSGHYMRIWRKSTHQHAIIQI